MGGGGGGVLDIMHGRSRMAMDPRIPTMSGQSASGFHRSGIRRLHKARSAVRSSASRMKGKLHSSENICEADSHIDHSFNGFIYFPVWPLPGTAMGVLCNRLVGALP